MSKKLSNKEVLEDQAKRSDASTIECCEKAVATVERALEEARRFIRRAQDEPEMFSADVLPRRILHELAWAHANAISDIERAIVYQVEGERYRRLASEQPS